jgi:CRP-like cAMP-binding protein
MTTTLQPSLEKHPFLENMSPDAMSLLTSCAKNVRFDAGEFLTKAGTDADNFYLIRTGRVEVTADAPSGPLIVATSGPGELVGWSWIISPYRYRFDAKAAEATVTFEFDGKCLRDKFDDHPSLGYQLLKRVSIALGTRLDELQLRLLDVYRGDSRA